MNYKTFVENTNAYKRFVMFRHKLIASSVTIESTC